MSTLFRIEMLPAREGDCLLISYEDVAGGRVRRVLVDGGRAGTYPALKARLLEIPEAEREFELLVVTHVDRDHIEGVLTMLDDPDCPVTFRDIWFNGYHHLQRDESFGAVQGERLTEKLAAGLPWNRAFEGRAVRIPDEGIGAPVELPGGLSLTVLSPTMEKLEALRPVWERECKSAGIVPSDVAPEAAPPGEEVFGPLNVEALAGEPFADDSAEANGSSIALLAEYDGRRVLLGADAHVGVLLHALDSLVPGERLQLDALKVAHHGSAANTSAELLERLECPRYLFSTNGSYFKHPNRSAVARVLKYGGDDKEILFNYRTDFTDVWDDPTLKARHRYEVRFPDDGGAGTLTLDL